MPRPDVLSLTFIILFLAALGAVFDKFIQSGRSQDWRFAAAGLWIKLNTLGSKNLSRDANNLYTILFDAVYGRRSFSKRRLIASLISTTSALVIITMALGYEDSIWVYLASDLFSSGMVSFIITILIPIAFNFVPDYFSLIETRYVLKWSRETNLFGIFGFIIVDFLLTTIIFVCGAYLFLFIQNISLIAIGGEPVFFGIEDIFGWITKKEFLLIFFLTTFVTSLFWIIFVMTSIIIWALHKMTRMAKPFFYMAGRSTNPGLSISGMLIIFVFGIHVIWMLLSFMIDYVL